MKINRPLWHAGALLSAQQFQQQARWESWANESLAHLILIHPWGVNAVDFDLQALRLGKLKATRLNLRLPDGTLVDSDHLDALPEAWDLARLPATTGSVLFVVALPLEQANGNNCLFEGAVSEKPRRYRQAWREVQDIHGEGREQIGVYEHALSLRPIFEADANHYICPVVRLLRDGQGGWVIDPLYVPPLLRLAAHPGLIDQLENLLTQLSTKRQRLMAMRRESNQRMADFAVADVSLFWLLNALNTFQPVLADLLKYPARHPEQVYQQLVKLAGGLLTFSLEHDIDSIPGYDHERLEAVLPVLMQTISKLLEASLPSRVVTLDMEQTGHNRWSASLHDLRLREPDGADFYLSVRCQLSAAQLQDTFAQLCKTGTPEFVAQLVHTSLEGVPLKSLGHVPAAIPLRLENQYFALDMTHPQGIEVLETGTCAFFVSAALTDVKLELFAVLRS